MAAAAAAGPIAGAVASGLVGAALGTGANKVATSYIGSCTKRLRTKPRPYNRKAVRRRMKFKARI